MKTINDIQLKDTLPNGIAIDKTISAAATAIDPHLQLIASKVDLPSLYTNIDNLSSLALDHLAAQYDVSVWRDSWTVALKRSVLKTALSDKRKKGTRSAVIKAVESIGGAASIVEWWETNPKGTPHTFVINVALSGIEGVLSDEQQEDLIRLIDDAKPLRSHYELVLIKVLNGGIGAYGCMRTLTYSSLRSGI